MKNTLVTGGAGFIGSNVASLLVEKGYRVTVLDNFSTGFHENLAGLDGVHVVEGDIRDGALMHSALKGMDVVFHLAATVGNLRSMEFPLEDAEINVQGTLNLLEAARAHRTKRIVFSSSAAIFGEVQRLPIDEGHPVEPDSPYGVTKLASEKHCLSYSRLYDMDIACLRYFNVFGVNQRFDPYGNVIPIWTDRLLAGKPLIIYGDGGQTRDFIDVKDVARANVLAGETSGARGAFNLGTGDAMTISALADVFGKARRGEVEVVHKPPRKGEVRDSQADISLARRTFGFEPSVGIEEGVAAYIDWVQSELCEGKPVTGKEAANR